MKTNQLSNRREPPLDLRARATPEDASTRWQQVLTRDVTADGQFFYAVKTTRIYCRPGCPSRRPARGNVSFFSTASAAEQAGFRPCKRCEPNRPTSQLDPQAPLVAAAVRHLQNHPGETVRLKELAHVTGAGRLTVLRAFRRVLGVSPQEFARAQRIQRFQEKLRPGTRNGSDTVPSRSSRPARSPGMRITDVIYEAGFGSPSRVYEKSADVFGMTPKRLRSGGSGLTIHYATAASPLGRVLVAASDIGVCCIAFAGTSEEAIAELRERFPNAQLTQDDAPSGWLRQAVKYVLSQTSEHPLAATFPLDVRATAFQQRVWKALQQIPRGETRSYSRVARELGRPSAVRAVASAISSNPIALAIPCHRVIGQNGTLTGYRWGLERKRLLLNAEGRAPAALLSEEKSTPTRRA